MSHPSVAVHRHAPVLALLLTLSACSSSPTQTDGEMPDFEGTYALQGTYTGRPGNSVQGSLVVTGQSGRAANATITVRLTDNGNTFFVLNVSDPGLVASSGAEAAALAEDGSFSVSYSGPEIIDGLDPADCCNFTFAMQGRLDGDRISGTWTLSRDMPSLDTGTFQATR